MSTPKNNHFPFSTRRHILKLLGISTGFGAGVLFPSSLRAATQPQKTDEQEYTDASATQKKQHVPLGVLTTFQVQPGKEAELKSFLTNTNNLTLIEKEPATTQWYSSTVRPMIYGTFAVFPNEAGRQAHLNGEFMTLLSSKQPELLVSEPKIELVDVISSTFSSKKSPEKQRLKANFGVRPRFEVQPGKEEILESLLRIGVDLTQEEPATREWFSLKIGPTTYGIFDVFQDQAGRQAHFDGPFTAILFATLGVVQASPPIIDNIDILAATINN